ncbi:MAG TPA: nicotinate phosphoribosyltransferase [Candidatus Nanoarchaeia archaeon]|nr:nicotinate phosphoribosyltransferase [Candidatus Nanoarchaeia archaeon]
MENKALLTDLYQLTMGAAYLAEGKNTPATFDLFIRKLPSDWGYFVANGIEDAIDTAVNLKFSEQDIAYLRSQHLFSEDYLDYLRNFKFSGEIRAVKEGTAVGPNTPLVSITAPRIEAQLLETILLNTINFQTLIASKASRVVHAAGDSKVVDFGLRRAHEESAGMKGARAAFIGGAVGTSNVKAGMEYGIPISGTHAHSFIMSFPSELESFRAYARTFPDKPTLLIDTYDTLHGAQNAAIVGKELEAKGHRLGAVRLDSGDLLSLSRHTRNILDASGLSYVKIIASNDLNEYKISELRAQEAPIDAYGVGTELITAKPVAALSGVYKLVEDDQGGKIKLAPGKKTYPGRKQVFRVMSNGQALHDILALENEAVGGTPLLETVVEEGVRLQPRRSLEEIRTYSLASVAALHAYDIHNPEAYHIKVSPGLQDMVEKLTKQYEVAQLVLA